MGSAPLMTEPIDIEESLVCAECGQANVLGEIFCTACGVSLEEGGVSVSLFEPLTLGTILADTYRLTSILSTGQENRYQAVRQTDAGQTYLIAERLSDQTDAGGAFELSEQLAAIHHPALILPQESLERDGRVYLITPTQSGIPLSSRMGRTSEREASGWGVQLCQAVSALHRHGFLCVELSPENIILDKTGRLHLTHFDAIRLKDALEESPFLTDGYAAPEAYKSQVLYEAADVFALGACLYAVLVGRRLPIEGWAVQPEPPVFYPEKVLTPDFERVLRRALAFEVGERYPNLPALKQDLLALSQSVHIRSAWRTDVGQVRDHNEDAVLVKEVGQGSIEGDDFNGLYIVSDGMGGAEAGEVASQIAIRTVAQHVEEATVSLPSGGRGLRRGGASTGQQKGVEGFDAAAWETHLCESVEAANTKIVQYGKDHPESAGLGATIVAALVRAGQLTVAWVGDSRVYLLENGELQQLSHDHSLVARLVEIGQLTEEEALTHEHRNVLIRSLGSKENVVVDTLSRPLKRGVRLLLCSDGLTSHVLDPAIADILSRHRTPSEAALELTVAANTGGGSDNTSVIVVFHE